MNLEKLQLLLVEDDMDLANAVIEYLDIEGIQCDHAANGLSALTLINENHYDVVILDLNLPKMSGLLVCETLREQGVDVPIIMLTAKDTLDDKLVGFEKGADDYLIKPFAMEELIVRIKVLSRRRSGQITKLTVAGLTLDTTQKTITNNNLPLKLSPTAYQILEILMRASPSPVSREKLIQSVWGEDQPDSNNLKVHIFNLRKTIEQSFDAGENKQQTQHCPQLIHTLVGRGFVLKDDNK